MRSPEISRGGQVFIHNRIENIKGRRDVTKTHQMQRLALGTDRWRKKLEELMLSFMNNEFDVLVSTTIVESGLDITNANTIFMHNANNFGL